MSKTKGKCVFNEKLREKYPYLEKAQSANTVFCKKCSSVFSIAGGGNSDISRHVNTAKHKAALKAASASKPIPSHFRVNDEKSAMEGVWAYHTINANQSFQSSECAAKIFKTCFKMENFSCSRTKCQVIVTGVFEPYAKQMLKNELEQCHYVSIYTDASNHGSIKIFTVLVRYFLPRVGICVKVLDISSKPGETSLIISDLIQTAICEFGLEKKVVAFCGDNAKVNFGGITRGGENNVFHRLQVTFPHLIGIGCTAHIVHNALKKACDVIPFDVEHIIVKIYAHFYLYTVRTEALKAFCDEADVEYKKLLGYAKTRFLALGPAIKRILQLFDALKIYFTKLPKGERVVKEFFNNAESKFWLLFVQEQVHN